MYSANHICEMVEFLIYNIFVKFWGRPFRQVIGIAEGTNWAPLLADLFLYSYGSDFLDKKWPQEIARSFNLCFRYIDDLIVFNNKKFWEYVKTTVPSSLMLKRLTSLITWQATWI